MKTLTAKILHHLRREKLLALLLLGGAAMVLTGTFTLKEAFHFVEWRTIGALCGLLMISCGLEDSGYLQWAGARFLNLVRGERGAAAVCVLGAAALSSVITNDVSLFIVVPLTVAAGSRFRGFPVGRLVIFEAMAVNIGSALSPVGNPQNLFLWQKSGVPALAFLRAMLPFGAVLLLLLLLAIPFAFSGPLEPLRADDRGTLRRPEFIASLLLYPAFWVALRTGHAAAALLGVTAIYAVGARRIFRIVDWPLLSVFILMFVDLRGASLIPAVKGSAEALLARPQGAFQGGVVLSQFISNVPAAILLRPLHPEPWKDLAWGVNAGGFGLAIGSLANLIALRLSRIRGLWREFHAWSLPMLLVAYWVGRFLL